MGNYSFKYVFKIIIFLFICILTLLLLKISQDDEHTFYFPHNNNSVTWAVVKENDWPKAILLAFVVKMGLELVP